MDDIRIYLVGLINKVSSFHKTEILDETFMIIVTDL